MFRVIMHITALLKDVNLQMLCDCGASFPWPSASTDHRSLPMGGLNFCPTCRAQITEFRPTPKVLEAIGVHTRNGRCGSIVGPKKPDEVRAAEVPSGLVEKAFGGDNPIWRSIERDMLGGLS